jgi:hypothetical protein
MLRPAAQLTALCTWLALGAGACNDADVVAHRVVEPAREKMEDASSPSCDIVSQLARADLPTGLANVFVDCQWPLRLRDNPDEVGALLPGHADAEDTQAAPLDCADNPYRWGQQPPRPERAQRLVYCPKACEAVKSWIRCKLRADVCNADDESDAGAADASTRCSP